jgi:hypothetical protein
MFKPVAVAYFGHIRTPCRVYQITGTLLATRNKLARRRQDFCFLKICNIMANPVEARGDYTIVAKVWIKKYKEGYYA